MRINLGKWRIAVETLATIAVLIGIKLVIEEFRLEFVTLNPLFTSILAGGIFLFGFLLAGTLADYKESERIPSDMVSACDSIYHEGRYVKSTKPEFDLDALVATISDVLAGFRADALQADSSRMALTAVSKLSDSFLEMERLGVPPNYIVRLKTEEGVLRKTLLRMYYIQKVNFLPSGYVLVQSVVLLVMLLLLFTKIEPFYDSVVVLTLLTYLFVYIMKLLKTLDTPFQASGTTMDDISLFQITEMEQRLRSG